MHRNAHTGAVVGLAADSFNHTLVSAGFDGWLRCWEFKKCRMGLEIQVGSAISKLAAHPGTALIAVAADDLVLRMCVLYFFISIYQYLSFDLSKIHHFCIWHTSSPTRNCPICMCCTTRIG